MQIRIFHCSGLWRRVVWYAEQTLPRRVFSMFSVVRVCSRNVLKMVTHSARNVYNRLVRHHTTDYWSVYRHSCTNLKSRTNKSVDVTVNRFVAQCRKRQWQYCSHLFESCASCSVLIGVKVALCVSWRIVRTITDSDWGRNVARTVLQHYRIVVVKREGKRPFGDILTDENNIKVDVKEIEWWDMEWMIWTVRASYCRCLSKFWLS